MFLAYARVYVRFLLSIQRYYDATIVTLNSTMGYSSATLAKIPLSDSEYYLVEVREESGYNNYTVSLTSVLVYMVDKMEESKRGIVRLIE